MIVYLDTSIPSFVLKTKILDKQKATEKLLKEVKAKRITAYISTVVIRELEKTTNEQKKKELMQVLNSFPYHLIELNEKMENVAKKYLASGIIPKKYQDDALHIAEGLPQIDLVTPWEVIPPEDE